MLKVKKLIAIVVPVDMWVTARSYPHIHGAAIQEPLSTTLSTVLVYGAHSCARKLNKKINLIFLFQDSCYDSSWQM